MSELKQKILNVIHQNPLSVLSTVTEDGKPMSRYMMVNIDESMTLFAVTGFSSRKVGQIRKNPAVHVILGYKSEEDGMNPWICLTGTAEILNDTASKTMFWKDEFKQYFKGPDDPEYCIIRMEPDRIEYWAGWQPEIWSR